MFTLFSRFVSSRSSLFEYLAARIQHQESFQLFLRFTLRASITFKIYPRALISPFTAAFARCHVTDFGLGPKSVKSG